MACFAFHLLAFLFFYHALFDRHTFFFFSLNGFSPFGCFWGVGGVVKCNAQPAIYTAFLYVSMDNVSMINEKKECRVVLCSVSGGIGAGFYTTIPKGREYLFTGWE
jgi:hypothetical protein